MDAQNQVVRKLEEKERVLQNNLSLVEKEMNCRQQALELHKRKVKIKSIYFNCFWQESNFCTSTRQPTACTCVVYLRIHFAYKPYSSVFANNVTNAYTQRSARHIEAHHSLSSQRGSDYSCQLNEMNVRDLFPQTERQVVKFHF